MKAWAQDFLKKHQGFTIVELLIVIVVIGILVAILFLGYAMVQNNAYDVSVKGDLDKFKDPVHLKQIDDEIVPVGGMTSSSVGDAKVFNGIHVVADQDSYDPSVANLYYCAGTIGGEQVFAFVAKSISGKVFRYLSNQGVSEYTTPLTLTATANGATVCTAMGFSAPYTWSYGYDPNPNYLWLPWTRTD